VSYFGRLATEQAVIQSCARSCMIDEDAPGYNHYARKEREIRTKIQEYFRIAKIGITNTKIRDGILDKLKWTGKAERAAELLIKWSESDEFQTAFPNEEDQVQLFQFIDKVLNYNNEDYKTAMDELQKARDAEAIEKARSYFSEKQPEWLNAADNSYAVFIKWEDNWADEMDLEGFTVCSPEHWLNYMASLMQACLFPHSVYMGTNEEIEYEKLDDYLRTLTVRGLSEEEFNLLFNVFDSWRNDREKKSLNFGKIAWIER